MIDRGPDYRQADGHIHAAIEILELDRDMPLIVVHRDDEIELASRCPMKQAVRRPGTCNIDPLGPSRLHRRFNLLLFFAAKEPLLSRVRVQAGHRDPRPVKIPCPANVVCQADHLQYTLFFDPITRLPKGDV